MNKETNPVVSIKMSSGYTFSYVSSNKEPDISIYGDNASIMSQEEFKNKIYNMQIPALTFDQAIEALNNGHKVKLPEWSGYWFKPHDDKILVMKGDGDIVDTPFMDDYRNRTDWFVTDGCRDFGGALKALRNNKRVLRKGWNGKGMWLSYLDPYNNKQFILQEKDIEGTFAPYIGMKTADNKYVPWLASQTDILAEDWEVL